MSVWECVDKEPVLVDLPDLRNVEQTDQLDSNTGDLLVNLLDNILNSLFFV